MVARLRCLRLSNRLRFGGATSLTMKIVVRQQSPQILGSRGKTAMARLRNNLLTTVARQQYWCASNLFQFGSATSQWQWRHVGNLLKFLMAVTLQCKCISNLLDNKVAGSVGVLLDSMSFVGR